MRALWHLLLMATAFPALAATPSSYTIGTAVETALRRNPTILKAREHLRELDETASRAVSLALPKLDATATSQHRKDAVNTTIALFGGEPYNAYAVGLLLAQPIYAGGALTSAMSLAHADQAIGALDQRIAERDLSLQVIQSFYSLLLNQKKLDALKSTEQVEKEQLATAQQRYKIGRGQLLDVLQVKTDVALLQPKIAQAEIDLQVTAAELASLLNENDSTAIQVTGDLALSTREKLDQLAAKSEPAQVPEVQRVEKQFDELDSTKNVDLAKYWPQLNAQAAWGRSAYVKSDLLSSDGTAWSLGLFASIPIFSGLSSIHERGVYASREKQLQSERARVLQSLSLEQVRTKKKLDLARETISSSEEAYKLAQDSLKEARRNFRLATIDYQRYLLSQQSYFNSEIAVNQARYDYIVSLARYFSAWGRDLTGLVLALGELK